MKKIYIISVCAITALSSCVKDAGDDRESVPIRVFTCSDDTKTALAADGLTINWSDADKVSVFDNFGQNNCLTASTSGSSSTTFEGTVSKSSTQLYAIYPYAASASIGGSSITTTLPSVQTAVLGSIPANTNIAVASATKGPTESEVTMTFRNACMFIRVALPAISALKKVSFSSLDGTLLSGTVSVNAASDEPVATVVEGVDSVALAGPFKTDGYYYLVLPAVTLNGFALTLDFGEFSITGTSTARITAVRGKIWDMSPADFLGSAEASIVHNYSDETLVGSTMTLTTSFDGISPDWTANIYDGRGTLVRTASGTGASTVETVPVAGTPYLPTTYGPYRVALSYTTENGSTLTKSSVATATAPAPTFTVSSNDVNEMYTSYDKYEAGDVTGANKLGGRTVYGIIETVSISNDVLNQLPMNVIYKSDKRLSGSGSFSKKTGQTSNVYGTFSTDNLPIGVRTLNLGATFDGVTIYSPDIKKTLSGIPESYDFGATAPTADWVLNGCERMSNENEVRWGYRLNYRAAFTSTAKRVSVFSAAYYTSENTYVSYSAQFRAGTNIHKGAGVTETAATGITSSSTTAASTIKTDMEEYAYCLTHKNPPKYYCRQTRVVMPNGYRVSFKCTEASGNTEASHWGILSSYSISYAE